MKRSILPRYVIIDRSVHHTFTVQIFEHGSWLSRDEEDGGFGPGGAGIVWPVMLPPALIVVEPY